MIKVSEPPIWWQAGSGSASIKNPDPNRHQEQLWILIHIKLLVLTKYSASFKTFIEKLLKLPIEQKSDTHRKSWSAWKWKVGSASTSYKNQDPHQIKIRIRICIMISIKQCSGSVSARIRNYLASRIRLRIRIRILPFFTPNLKICY